MTKWLCFSNFLVGHHLIRVCFSSALAAGLIRLLQYTGERYCLCLCLLIQQLVFTFSINMSSSVSSLKLTTKACGAQSCRRRPIILGTCKSFYWPFCLLAIGYHEQSRVQSYRKPSALDLCKIQGQSFCCCRRLDFMVCLQSNPLCLCLFLGSAYVQYCCGTQSDCRR